MNVKISYEFHNFNLSLSFFRFFSNKKEPWQKIAEGSRVQKTRDSSFQSSIELPSGSEAQVAVVEVIPVVVDKETMGDEAANTDTVAIRVKICAPDIVVFE